MAEWRKTASLYDGPLAVGGSIRIDSARLRFRPHAFDRALKGCEVDIALETITRLELTKRSWIAPRRHALVETREGVRARFLVNGGRDVLRQIAERATQAGAEFTVVGLT